MRWKQTSLFYHNGNLSIPAGNVITVGSRYEVQSECNTWGEANEDHRKRRATVRVTTLHATNGPLNPGQLLFLLYQSVLTFSSRRGKNNLCLPTMEVGVGVGKRDIEFLFERGCAAKSSKYMHISKHHFGRKGYPLLGIWIKIWTIWKLFSHLKFAFSENMGDLCFEEK